MHAQLGPTRRPAAYRARIEGLEVFGRTYSDIADSLFEEHGSSPARHSVGRTQVPS